MTYAIIVVVVFLAILTQAVSGSGLALVAMPLLVGVLDPLGAATLVSLLALTTQLLMLTRYHQLVQAKYIWRLTVGSVLGVPIGIMALSTLDKHIILTILGIVLIGYALYSLFVTTFPELKNPRYAYFFGFMSGILGGAYNTSGPPVVIYGMGQRWDPAGYKGNLQAALMANSSIVVGVHLLSGHITSTIIGYYAVAFPVILMALVIGFGLDKVFNAITFRRVVTAVLMAIGVKMLLP